MKKYIKLMGAFFLCASLLIACSDNKQENEPVSKSEANDETDSSTNQTSEENMDDPDEGEGMDTDGDQEIEGKVILDEENSMIRLEAETNLLEHTPVEAILDKAYGEASIDIATLPWESTEVDSDGSVSLEYPLDEDFFDTYQGENFEFMVEFKSSGAHDDLVDAYGEDGKDFSGPFAYRSNSSISEGKKLLVPTYFRLGDDQMEYPIETPERKEKPDDYGDTEVWIDAEVVDNDHDFLYVEGKTNLVEGTMLQGRYYPEKETLFYDGLLTQMFVEPDGTFRLPVKYDSMTHDGYIEIKVRSMYAHRAGKDIYDTYGDGFQNMTGDDVQEDEDRQEIELIIDTEGMNIAIPDDSFATEDNGELKIQVPDDVLFDFDQSDLKTAAKDTLDEVIDVLEDVDDDRSVQINGHTDNEGDPDYNLNLSKERAEAAEKYLSKNGAIDHLSIDVNGYGETKPIESNADEEGQKKNRRVEIVIESVE